MPVIPLFAWFYHSNRDITIYKRIHIEHIHCQKQKSCRKNKVSNSSRHDSSVVKKEKKKRHCDPRWLHLICTISICHLLLRREWSREKETDRKRGDACVLVKDAQTRAVKRCFFCLWVSDMFMGRRRPIIAHPSLREGRGDCVSPNFMLSVFPLTFLSLWHLFMSHPVTGCEATCPNLMGLSSQSGRWKEREIEMFPNWIVLTRQAFLPIKFIAVLIWPSY